MQITKIQAQNTNERKNTPNFGMKVIIPKYMHENLNDTFDYFAKQAKLEKGNPLVTYFKKLIDKLYVDADLHNINPLHVDEHTTPAIVKKINFYAKNGALIANSKGSQALLGTEKTRADRRFGGMNVIELLGHRLAQDPGHGIKAVIETKTGQKIVIDDLQEVIDTRKNVFRSPISDKIQSAEIEAMNKPPKTKADIAREKLNALFA